MNLKKLYGTIFLMMSCLSVQASNTKGSQQLNFSSFLKNLVQLEQDCQEYISAKKQENQLVIPQQVKDVEKLIIVDHNCQLAEKIAEECRNKLEAFKTMRSQNKTVKIEITQADQAVLNMLRCKLISLPHLLVPKELKSFIQPKQTPVVSDQLSSEQLQSMIKQQLARRSSLNQPGTLPIQEAGCQSIYPASRVMSSAENLSLTPSQTFGKSLQQDIYNLYSNQVLRSTEEFSKELLKRVRAGQDVTEFCRQRRDEKEQMHAMAIETYKESDLYKKRKNDYINNFNTAEQQQKLRDKLFKVADASA